MYFYGFVVDHGVDGYGGGFVVGGVGLFAEFCAPRSGEDREGGVGGHGEAGDEGKLPAVLVGLGYQLLS
jgi:hypothetical protein